MADGGTEQNNYLDEGEITRLGIEDRVRARHHETMPLPMSIQFLRGAVRTANPLIRTHVFPLNPPR